MKSFRMRANARDVPVPLSRDLVGMRLVQLHTLARQFDWAESVAAELKDTPVAHELRQMLVAARWDGFTPGRLDMRCAGISTQQVGVAVVIPLRSLLTWSHDSTIVQASPLGVPQGETGRNRPPWGGCAATRTWGLGNP